MVPQIIRPFGLYLEWVVLVVDNGKSIPDARKPVKIEVTSRIVMFGVACFQKLTCVTSCKFNEIIDVKSIVRVVEIFQKEHHIIYIKDVHQVKYSLGISIRSLIILYFIISLALSLLCCKGGKLSMLSMLVTLE